MSGGAVPRHVIAGERQHGVARYAHEVADALGAGVSVAPAAGDEAAELPEGGRLHLHFTDRVWGADPGAAARRVEALAAALPLTVTLHDLPQPSDGAASLARRIEGYRRVARAARGVVVSSEHEAALLRDVVGLGAAVIPLPVDVRPAAAAGPVDDELAVLGYVYPGKGHAEALAAVAALSADGVPPLGVTALGRASAGHEAELAALTAAADRLGVRFSVTGYLDEAELLARCRRARVPLAAHQHVSASGSLVTWIAAGRRPLVPDTRYSREMAALRPGTVTLYDPDDLAGAVGRAWRDPASTWWDADAGTGPTLPEVAAAYRAWWAHDVAW